jgi:hypothetical protein
MARVPYADRKQLSELKRQSDFPGGVPISDAFRTFAHEHTIGALRLVLALLTETALDPKNVAWPALSVKYYAISELKWKYENAT